MKKTEGLCDHGKWPEKCLACAIERGTSSEDRPEAVLWTFAMRDCTARGEVWVWSARSFRDEFDAETSARAVSLLMGGVKYVVKKVGE